METNYKLEFSQNLQLLMNDKELNGKTLGDLLGIASSSIGQWLNMEYLASFSNLIKLTNYFHTSIDFLFSFTDKRHFFPIFEINFYDNLQNILKNRNISKQKLRKKCGFNYSQFSKWNKGSLPQTEVLLNIAKYLELPVEYIIGRTDKTEL